jgi:hypothetical protein
LLLGCFRCNCKKRANEKQHSFMIASK